MSVLGLIPAVLGAAESALDLLEEREKNYPLKQAKAFRERLHKIRKKYYEEYNKPIEKRSDAVLDHTSLELRLFLSDFTASVRPENVSH